MNKYLRLYIFLLLAIINCSCSPSLRNSTANASSLADAYMLIETGNLKQARSILSNYQTNKDFAVWIKLLSAKIEEKEKNYILANQMYSSIAKDEAASLDASIGILRILGRTNKREFYNSLKNIGFLEQKLKNARRHDLIAELRDLKSLYLEKKVVKPTLSAQAQFQKSIKDSWNKNHNEKTLSLLSQYKKNYGLKNLTDDLQYIYAKTLADMEKDKEAEINFLYLVENSKNYDLKIKAIKHLAWKAYFSQNISAAEKYFRLAAETSDRKLSQVKSEFFNSATDSLAQEIRNYLADKVNFLYWQAKCAEALGNTKMAESLSKEIISLSPYSFYALYSLQADSPFDNQDKCKDDVSDELDNKISIISKYGIDEITANEINWYYSRGGKISDVITPTTNEQLRKITEKTSLLLKYKRASDASAIADHAFRIAHFIAKEKNLNSDCIAKLYFNSYPIAYNQYVTEAAETFSIEPSLILAITRTESLFNPYARSSAEAKGLMQLLSSTAQNEGLKANESLYNPQTNIYYGSKHISGLIKNYQGKVEPAVAAYNAGKNATDRWLKKHSLEDTEAWIENITFPETRNYVQKVMTAKKVYDLLLKSKSYN